LPYIHELPGWPAFRWETAALMPVLSRVRLKQGVLIGRMQEMGFTVRDRAVIESVTAEAVKSAEIEGEALDARQVRSSVARRLGVERGGLPKTPAARAADAMAGIVCDAVQDHAAPLTADRLCRWQAALFPPGFSGQHRVAAGRFRQGPVEAVSGPEGRERIHFEGPPAERVPADMAAFLRWFESEGAPGAVPMDPLLRAAIAHLWLVTIHPFEDGNGRIARAVTELALARSESSPKRFYSLSSQIRAEREDYYRILETVQKGDLDVTAWALWFLGCLERALEGSEAALAAVLRKARFWHSMGAVRFNDRQRKVLDLLLDAGTSGGLEGNLTSSRWMKICGCSQATANRDIDELLEWKILRQNPGGGRSTSYALAPPF